MGGIYNILHRCLTNDELKEYLVKSREAWRAALRSSGMGVVIFGHSYTPDEVLDLWINGVYFHNDSEKADRLKKLVPLAHDLLRHQFIDFLVNATREILNVADILNAALQNGHIATECQG
jgi:hypothetical protein